MRPQLLALAKANKPELTYVIDTLVQTHGHKVLRLPPYHPDLNPIELIWAQVKKMVSARNFTYRLNDVLEITNNVFTLIGTDRWERACNHVDKIEGDYRSKDIAIDIQMDKFVINLADDTDSDGSATSTASEGEN